MKQILGSALFLIPFFGFSQDFILDPNFGNDTGAGYFAQHIGSSDEFRKVTSDSSDNIYYVGETDADAQNIIIASTTADGSMNPAFGGDFFKTFQIPGTGVLGPSRSIGNFITMQNNKVLVGVRIEIDDFTRNYISVFRLNLDGTLDTTFGVDGFYIYALSDADLLFIRMSVNDQNEIFICGRYLQPPFTLNRYLVQKITPEGDVDSSFGTDGSLIFGNYSGHEFISSILFLDDGQLLVSGTEQNNQIFRLSANGVIDTTFGIDGDVSTNLPLSFFSMKKIGDWYYAAGALRSTSSKSVIIRFNETGLDTNFGVNGLVETSFNPGDTQSGFFSDDGNVYFASTSINKYQIFKTHIGDGFIPFATDNLVRYSNFGPKYIISITQLSTGAIIGGGRGLYLFGDSSTGNDMYAIKLTASNLSVPSFETNAIRFFPNPVSDLISFNKEISGAINIYTVDGKLLLERQMQNEKILDLSVLNKGIYILNLPLDDNIIYEKFIKN